jgi:protein CpxP
MNVYKRFLAITASAVLVLGLGLTTARAQDSTSTPPDNAAQNPPPQGGMREGRGGMNPDQMLARLDQRLHLSDDQKGKIRTILQDRVAAMQKLRSDTSMPQDERRSKMQSISADHNDQIKAVLTDDQKKEFDQMMEHRGGMRNGGGNPPPPDSQSPPPPPPNQ